MNPITTELDATRLVLASKNETIDGLIAVIASQRADIETLREILSELEWAGTSEFTEDVDACCPICHASQWSSGKHADDCALDKAKGTK